MRLGWPLNAKSVLKGDTTRKNRRLGCAFVTPAQRRPPTTRHWGRRRTCPQNFWKNPILCSERSFHPKRDASPDVNNVSLFSFPNFVTWSKCNKMHTF